MSDECDEEDEPLSPEEEAEFEASMREADRGWEIEATRIFGPPEVRIRKNQRYANRLVARYSEPVIRGLLVALSRLEKPLCAHWLSEIDLSTTPLAEIINPFEICGRRFIILSVVGLDYTVKISSGFGTAGDGGQFVFTRDGEAFMLKDELSYWIN
jgi:hypothetical protein